MEETFTISEDNWIKKELPHKMLMKTTTTTTTTNWKCKPHQAKGFIRRRNFHNIRRKLHNERIVDCVKKNKNIVLYFNRLSNNYLKYCEFACFYNIWHAKVQLHMLSMKHKNFIYIVQIKTTSPTSVFVLNWTWFNWCTFMYHTRLIQTFWNTWCEKQIIFFVLKENNL